LVRQAEEDLLAHVGLDQSGWIELTSVKSITPSQSIKLADLLDPQRRGGTIVF
jgi:hypothetical protein